MQKVHAMLALGEAAAAAQIACGAARQAPSPRTLALAFLAVLQASGGAPAAEYLLAQLAGRAQQPQEDAAGLGQVRLSVHRRVPAASRLLTLSLTLHTPHAPLRLHLGQRCEGLQRLLLCKDVASEADTVAPRERQIAVLLLLQVRADPPWRDLYTVYARAPQPSLMAPQGMASAVSRDRRVAVCAVCVRRRRRPRAGRRRCRPRGEGRRQRRGELLVGELRSCGALPVVVLGA